MDVTVENNTNKPKIFYDAECFICSNYIRFLKIYTPSDKLDYEPMTEKSDNFIYQSIDGTLYYGHDGIDKLMAEVPETTSSFDMVPYWVRHRTAHALYTLGGAARAIIKRVGGGCCGRA